MIDFVPDELESKLEIVCMVDRMAPPKTVLCIHTRTLSVSDLANCTYRSDRCIGVAFQDSAANVLCAYQTSQQTRAALEDFLASCGLSVTVTNEPQTISR